MADTAVRPLAASAGAMSCIGNEQSKQLANDLTFGPASRPWPRGFDALQNGDEDTVAGLKSRAHAKAHHA